MKNKYLISLLTSSTIALFISPVLGKSTITPPVMFTCEDDQGMPITIAKNSKGDTQTIFHWKSNALPTSSNPQELCERTSEKFNDYAAESNNLSSLRIISAEQLGLPAICITEEKLVCSKVLFTLNPHHKPIDIAQTTLKAILDHKLQNKYTINKLASPTRCEERGCQLLFPSFQLNLFQDQQ